MPAKQGLTMQADYAVRAREIDFVTRFAKNWDALREVMGIMRPIEAAPGTELKTYEATVTLAQSVGEGVEIPYSPASVTEKYKENVTVEKYAKAVSIEAVQRYGAQIAIERTDAAFLNELQGNVLDRFYTFLQTGTLKSKEATFQMAIAMAIGRVVDKFKKMRRDYSTPIVFVNTLDAYAYLGAANITIQTANGLQYVRDFMGAGVMILSSEIGRNTVIATLADNIILYYVNPSNSDYARLGLNYTVQGETPLIGFHANGNYNTAVGESFAIMGLRLWAEYLDAIAVINVDANSASITFDSAEIKVSVGGTGSNTVVKVPANATLAYTSADTSIATVDSSTGVVTGVAKGRTVITATDATNATSNAFEVIVK